MNRRPEPPDQPDRRTTPIPPRQDWGRTQPAPRRPVPPPPPRPPAQPPAQPWYLEFRRPPAPPSPPSPPRVPPRVPPPTPPKSAAPQPQSNRGLWIGAGVSVVLVFAVLGTLMLSGLIGGPGPVELDVTHAQAGVRQVLTDPIDGYGRENVGDVRCNNGVNPKVHKGRNFSCVVTVDGAQRKVLVEFADDAGTYEVDRPR